MKLHLPRIFGKKAPHTRIHLDFASTTPVREEILKEMQPYFNEVWANPSAIYKEGAIARGVIDTAREELARTLRVRAHDVTFTSGGTESNNLALIGYVEALHETGKAYGDMEIISSRLEHPSILETLIYLEKRGVRVAHVSVDEEGLIHAREVESLLNPSTVLVTFAYANSEIGVVQDVKKITRAIRAYNELHKVKIMTHIDASQAPLWLSCALDMLGVDMMTLDAGKCYGPKGVGVLAHRHWVPLSPYLHGGGQERGLRSGTENTALVVGCVRAIVLAQATFEKRSVDVLVLQSYFFIELTKHFPQCVINGSVKNRIANNINISIPGLDTEYATIWLDSKGVSVSTRSACGAVGSTGSSVVREISHDEARATSTLRFTLGEGTTQNEVDTAIAKLKECVNVMSRG